MRISDWSSDVCSSDLFYIASAGLGHLRGEAGRPCRWCGARVNDQLAAHSPRESVTAAAEYGVSRIGPREHQDPGCAAIENLLDACCRFCAGFHAGVQLGRGAGPRTEERSGGKKW